MLKSVRLFAVLAAAAIALVTGAGVAQAKPSYLDLPVATHHKQALADGLVRTESVYGFEETIARIRADVAAKGIKEFAVVRQSDLASGAGVSIAPSALIIFGNPPLGTLFLSENPNSGIDWPVRVLVYENKNGDVSVVYTDFNYLKRRYGIEEKRDAIKMADMVIHSIVSSVELPRG